MTFTRRQILVTLGALALLGLAAFVAFRGSSSSTLRGTVQSEATKTLVASELKMLSPTHNPKDQSVYFFDYGEVKLAKVDDKGQVAYLSDRLSGIEQAVWAPDFSKVLLRNINDLSINPESVDASPLLRRSEPNQAVLTWLYDLGSRKLTFVSSRYGSVVWSGSEQIVYEFTGEAGQISEADADGSNFRPLAKILDVGIDQILGSTSDKRVIFSGGNTEEDSNLYFVAGEGTTSTQIAENASGFASEKSVVYVTQDQSIFSYDLTTGQKRRLLTIKDPLHQIAVGKNEIIVATAKIFTVITLSDSQKIEPKDITPPTKLEYLIPIDSEKAFYFTSAGALYRVDLP